MPTIEQYGGETGNVKSQLQDGGAESMDTTGIAPHWTQIIQAWAENEPLILEAYAFGSRVKGGYQPDSDLDIAVKVDGADEGEILGNAICLKPRWTEALQAQLPIKLHLQTMMPDDTVVTPAVQQHGMLLYRKVSILSRQDA